MATKILLTIFTVGSLAFGAWIYWGGVPECRYAAVGHVMQIARCD